MRFALIFILLGFIPSFVAAQPTDLQEGQSWSFQDAPHPDTRLVIGKIEPLWDEQEMVVSVSVVNLNSNQGMLIGGSIAHLPFAASTLRQHLIELDDPVFEIDPSFSDGYRVWKLAVKQDGAGVFTVSPAEAIEFVFDTVMEGR